MHSNEGLATITYIYIHVIHTYILVCHHSNFLIMSDLQICGAHFRLGVTLMLELLVSINTIGFFGIVNITVTITINKLLVYCE